MLGTVDARDGLHVALWDGVTVIDLGAGQAQAINNSGQAVGSAPDAAGVWHATTWTRSGPTTLGPTTGRSGGLDINDRGQVVGWGAFTGGETEATIWQNGDAVALGPGVSARAINNLGQVVGGDTLWDANGVTWVGYGAAVDINDRGQVVANFRNHGYLWQGTTSVQLGVAGGFSSAVFAINEKGQSDGSFSYGVDPFVGSHAALWNGTVGIDLNSLLRPESVAAGWSLDWARGINDNGWITGLAHNTNDCAFGLCKRFGFVLSDSALPDQFLNITGAIPEPSTYALMLAGLAALGWWSQRRRAASASK